MKRLLLIRGGAIGDFILTLPAIGGLRHAFPQAHIEVVGDPRRAILARHPAYADQITDQAGLDLYRLFSRRSRVPPRLAAYLRSFAAILAYLPRAHEVFTAQVRQVCAGEIVIWSPQPPAGLHITDHLLQPVRRLRPQQYDPIPRVYLPAAAEAAAERFWRHARLPDTGVIAVHPGSGGAHKLWPLPAWQRVLTWVAAQDIPCILLRGPAEQDRVAWLLRHTALPPWACAGEMPILHLAAILARCRVMVGHDSGITHLAAAAGCTTLALFGPTDPLTWAPRSPRTCVLQPHPRGPLSLESLPPEVVIQTLEALHHDTFLFTPSDIGCTLRRVSNGDAQS